ncbi:DUF982 domain-containing protein [Rhizobium tubonense]
MTNSLWNRPVKIRLKGWEAICIRTTAEAARCLINDWPAKKDNIYRLAVVSCTNALRGRLPDIAARIHFIAAAQAVDLDPVICPDIREPDQFVADLCETCGSSIFSPICGS